MIAGVQGTGKSLTAKAIANDWKLPLLRLDIGRLFGGIVGESESRVRQMIQISEALAPCILWIDEIDKAFMEQNNRGDNGTSSRVLATLLLGYQKKLLKFLLLLLLIIFMPYRLKLFEKVVLMKFSLLIYLLRQKECKFLQYF